jgi:hypothetical protein
MWKNFFITGCSKKVQIQGARNREPAPEGVGLSIALDAKKFRGVRRTLKYAAMARDEGNAVDGPFSTTCQEIK